jgi:hypothetical protein
VIVRRVSCVLVLSLHAMTDFLSLIMHHGYIVISLIVFAEAIGVPVPGAVALVTGGARRQRVPFRFLPLPLPVRRYRIGNCPIPCTSLLSCTSQSNVGTQHALTTGGGARVENKLAPFDPPVVSVGRRPP